MERRIARFESLKPLPIQNASIPEKARDVVYSRKLLLFPVKKNRGLRPDFSP